jgi:polar amino acid transport system substrate-binding protein
MLRIALGLLGATLLSSSPALAQVSAGVRSEMAPSGTLRAGINLGNILLAQGTQAGGDLRGVAVDLSRELARRLGVPIEFVTYDAAGKMTDAVKTGAWDVAFLGVDPARAGEITFTAPYLEIEGTYLVPDSSPIRAIGDVDREGVRVAVGAKSAYDLFLTRSLTRATLVRAPSSPDAIDMFVKEKLEVVAGVKATLVSASKRLPATRVIDGRFMTIQQGAGVPKGRDAAARYLSAFIEEVKASGFVAAALKKSGVDGEASVAPPAVP